MMLLDRLLRRTMAGIDPKSRPRTLSLEAEGAFYQALCDDDDDRIRRLMGNLDLHPDQRFLANRQQPLLLQATDALAERCVDALLEAGAAPDGPAGSRRTPLFALLKLAASSGASHRRPSNPRWQKKERPDIILRLVRRLLDAGADPAQSDERVSLLHFAVESGDVRVLTSLLQAGAPVGAVGKYGSPLLVAIQGGRTDMIGPLLAHGADPNGDSGDPAPPVVVAALNSHPKTLARLIACAKRSKRPLDLDRPDRDGDTALCVAVSTRKADIARALLRAGADPERPGGEGLRPLHLAVSRNCRAGAEVLLAGNADPNGADARGRTPLRVWSETVSDPHAAFPLPPPRAIQAAMLRRLVAAGARGAIVPDELPADLRAHFSAQELLELIVQAAEPG